MEHSLIIKLNDQTVFSSDQHWLYPLFESKRYKSFNDIDSVNSGTKTNNGIDKYESSFILDNPRGPDGGSVKETLKNGEYKLRLNFPGLHLTRTIADVIRYNIDQLIAN